MVDLAILRFTGEKEPLDGWRHYFSSKDIVGIKLNCLGGKMLSTHPLLAKVVAKSLNKIGISEKNIILWDLTNRELKEAGFELNFRGSGFRCFGTDTEGVGYENELTVFRSVGSLLSRIMTSLVNVSLNLPILKDHNLAGISGGMKNFYGAIHNPNKYHDTQCNPYVADVNSLPAIKEKNRLTLCDCLRVQYQGGPSYKKQWVEYYQGIILGSDPVAVDLVGLQIIERLRKKYGLPDLKKAGRYPGYLETAADKEHRLGVFRAEGIELIEEKIG